MQYLQRERERANYKLPGYLCQKKKHPPPLKQSNPQLHLPMELSNLDCDSFGAEFIPRCLEVVDLRRCWLPGGCQNQLINQHTNKWIDLYIYERNLWKLKFLYIGRDNLDSYNSNTWPVWFSEIFVWQEVVTLLQTCFPNSFFWHTLPHSASLYEITSFFKSQEQETRSHHFS